MGRKDKVILNKKVLLREGSALLLSQVVFISFLFNDELNGFNGFFLVLIYLAYLGLLFGITRRSKKKDPGFVTPDEGPLRPWLFRILTLDVNGTVLNGKNLNRKRAWLLLGISTLIMSGGTWMLVLGTDLFGHATNIPLIFVAVVLSAAATSVPDTILSMKDAKKGNYDDAVSNALGSNIFDIAFALGLPILLYNLIYGQSIILPGQIMDFTQEVWVFLLLATILGLVIMLWGKYFTRGKAWLLLGIYIAFLFFVGTQVNEGLGNILGDQIKDFLTFIADLIGDLFY
jgi:cation:H+ antiporter